MLTEVLNNSGHKSTCHAVVITTECLKHDPKFLCCTYIFSLISYYMLESSDEHFCTRKKTIVWYPKILNCKTRQYLRVIVNRFPES